MNYLITGSNRGIGLELAKQLSARGEQVWAGYRGPSISDGMEEIQKNHQDTFFPLELDVTKVDQVQAAAGVDRQPHQVAGIRRDLRFMERNVEHGLSIGRGRQSLVTHDEGLAPQPHRID